MTDKYTKVDIEKFTSRFLSMETALNFINMAYQKGYEEGYKKGYSDDKEDLEPYFK